MADSCSKCGKATPGSKFSMCTACHKGTTTPPATSPATPTPPATPSTIQVTETETTQTGNRLTIKIEVKTNKVTSVRMKKGMRELCVQSTDSNREAVFVHYEDLEDTARTATLKFMTPDDQVATAIIDIPAKVTAPVAPKTDDPVTCSLFWSALTNNKFKLNMHVCKTGGYGVVAPVVFTSSEGVVKKTSSDSTGFVNYSYPNEILPGHNKPVVDAAGNPVLDAAGVPTTKHVPNAEVIIRAKVDGILEVAQVTLKHPPEPLPTSAGKNNLIAFWMRVACLALWLIGFGVGFGGPIINNTDQELQVTKALQGVELTAQAVQYRMSSNGQSYLKYTNITELGSGNLVVSNIEPSNNGKRIFWLMIVIFTIATGVYTFWAQHEEVKYEIELWAFKTFVKKSSNVADPMFEKIGTYLGTFAKVQQATNVSVLNPDISTPATSKTTKNSFWELLRSELFGDIILDLGPKLFKKLIWR